MTIHPKDPLLITGKVIAAVLQGICAVAGGIFFLLIPLIVLLSQGMLPGFGEGNDLPDVAKYPLLGAAIAFVIMANLAAMFAFFGRIRALIESAAEGDPFIPENARRLNAMAWVLLAASALAVLVGELRVTLANLADPQGPNAVDYSPYDLLSLLIVLTLFILARVFRQGAMMREELEGTV
ncbi:MAG: DUF2975 domain-containing protein [Erythrobacter sp.]